MGRDEELPVSSYRPGDLVRNYANRHGWSIANHNIIVEGEIDQRYATLASKLYQEKTGLSLIGIDLAVFPTGIGDEGGTYGIQRQLPTLDNLSSVDFDADGRRVVRFVAILDSDSAGKCAARALTAKHMKLRANRDVFLLQRLLPRRTRDPDQLGRLIEQSNSKWNSLDCEIEDLLPLEILQDFVRSDESTLKRTKGKKNPLILDGGHHFEFEAACKGRLVRYVEKIALLSDLSNIVEMLKSVRFYLGIDPDGV